MRSPRLPTCFPVGTKYILEGRGLLVERYVEFPNGRKVRLPSRKAASHTACAPLAPEHTSIVPDQSVAVADTPRPTKRLVS